MFDSLKFSLSDNISILLPTKLTALALLDFLYDTNLITRENAYDICKFLARAEPRQEYNAGTFRIIALDY